MLCLEVWRERRGEERREGVEGRRVAGRRVEYYETHVCFWIQVWVRDSVIFEKVRCRCSRVLRLKNY